MFWCSYVPLIQILRVRCGNTDWAVHGQVKFAKPSAALNNCLKMKYYFGNCVTDSLLFYKVVRGCAAMGRPRQPCGSGWGPASSFTHSGACGAWCSAAATQVTPRGLYYPMKSPRLWQEGLRCCEC